MADSQTAFAPASIGNVGVGFDMLGLALTGVGDRVTATRSAEPGVTVTAVYGIDGAPHPELSAAAAENTASIAAAAFWSAHGDRDGIAIEVHKGVPLQSGMGSSAASAVAGVVAANALLERPLGMESLLMYALEGERYASGGLHADNVAPSLLGGLVLCPVSLLPATVRLPVPTGVSAVLVHPELSVNTAAARRGLDSEYPLERVLEQQGYLAGFVAACASGDLDLLATCLRDVLIEPQRAASVPCFVDVKQQALRAGAMGCSLSGSGPSMFALCEVGAAADVADAMQRACRAAGIECQAWTGPLDAPGARVER